MTDELSYGREPVEIVELVQPRCGRRFGVAPCTASGTPKCYNTWGTCLDRANYDPSGTITWRFAKPDAGILPLYSQADSGNTIKTNPIPLLRSVRTTPSRINVASQREGQAPLGIRGTISVEFAEAPWDDHVGDYYLADRSGVQGGFWQKWRARTLFYAGYRVNYYQGYRGQALGDMQVKAYFVDKMEGFGVGGRCNLHGIDPLGQTDRKRALFPPVTDMLLEVDITATQTTGIKIRANATLFNLACGNTGTRKFLTIGSEVLLYTGHTDLGGGVRRLEGVARGAVGTVAAEHKAGVSCQRAGRYEGIEHYLVAKDLLENHTPVDGAFVDGTQWDEEGNDYLSTMKATRTIPEPEPVDELLGQLCQQGNFMIWWDEREQTIPLLAVRPPREAPTVITGALNIIADSAAITDKPDAQLTRVIVYYDQRSPTVGRDDTGNYRSVRIQIDNEIEQEGVGGEVRTLRVFAPWVTTDNNALQIAARILLRYRLIPRYLRFDVDAKDRGLSLGDVLDVTTREFVNSEGEALSTRWQVIGAEETQSGHKMRLELQSYEFIGRFGFIMANDANDYADATTAELATGCYMSEDDPDLMPDGGEPYLLQ